MSHRVFRTFFVLVFILAQFMTGITPALAAVPANDNFAGAVVITSLPFSATVDNTDATIEPGEPYAGCAFPFRSVWYSFTPTENVAVQVDMAGSTVGGAVQILRASGPTISDLTNLACAFSGSSANLQFDGGTTYYLRVDSNGQAGNLQINLQQLTPPSNDSFANPVVISSLPFSMAADNTNATVEASEPSNCN
jgi:hypothetical protein